MAKQRVLILSSDPKQIENSVRDASLAGVHFTVHSDWEKGVSALSKENFSVIVARKFRKTQTAEAFVEDILSLAPKTPLILILPKKGGPSVLGGLRGGASEIIFDEDLGRELLPTLEKYLFLGHGLLRKMSLDELFDYCFPVITTTDMDLLGYTVIEMFKESLGASFGILFREQEGRGTGFSVLATAGFPDDSMAGVFLLRFGAGITKLSSTAPAVFPAEGLASLAPEDEAMLGENRTFFALRFDLSPMAGMHVVLAMRGVPSADVLGSTLLNFFYRQARFALLNAERGAKTQNLIYIDDLTKLYNNRYLNVVLDRELKRSERYRNFFSVLFMDLDFFKRVNDSHGHLVGTRVLVEAGNVLRLCVRETDTVVRYGGDEFVVLLVETRAEEAILVAERMRKMIEEKPFGQEMGLAIRLTISIGIAAFPEHATTKQSLLNLADQAMYRGKDSTRNVVYLAGAQNVP
ncbi:MAG TPA: GGDEF domain-containing protein [Candidatus Deferrimicrobiaceae bacterium]|nr:GGDEF domain-containing protein [Candidatus Deferrimicrobiaceae bacterium]